MLFPMNVKFMYETSSIQLISFTLRWRHNECDSISNHQPGNCQPFIQAQIKENIKALHHWPLWGEFTGDRSIPHTKGQWRGKCFHLMTSSWVGTVAPEHQQLECWVCMNGFSAVYGLTINEWPSLMPLKAVILTYWLTVPLNLGNG